MRFTDEASTRRRRTLEGQSEAARFEKASASCWNKEGIATAARTLLAEAVASAMEAAYNQMRPEFGVENAALVTADAEAAVVAINSGVALQTGGRRPSVTRT